MGPLKSDLSAVPNLMDAQSFMVSKKKYQIRHHIFFNGLWSENPGLLLPVVEMGNRGLSSLTFLFSPVLFPVKRREDEEEMYYCSSIWLFPSLKASSD